VPSEAVASWSSRLARRSSCQMPMLTVRTTHQRFCTARRDPSARAQASVNRPAAERCILPERSSIPPRRCMRARLDLCVMQNCGSSLACRGCMLLSAVGEYVTHGFIVVAASWALGCCRANKCRSHGLMGLKFQYHFPYKQSSVEHLLFM
jgi:hypothetical protein